MSKNKKTKGLFTIEGNEKRGRREGDYNRTELKGVSSPWQHLCGCYLAKEMRPQTPTPISGNPTLQLLCLPSLFKYWKVLKLFIHPVFFAFMYIYLLSRIERIFFYGKREREGGEGQNFIINIELKEKAPHFYIIKKKWGAYTQCIRWQVWKQTRETYANNISSISLHHDQTKKGNVQFTLRLKKIEKKKVNSKKESERASASNGVVSQFSFHVKMGEIEKWASTSNPRSKDKDQRFGASRVMELSRYL